MDIGSETFVFLTRRSHTSLTSLLPTLLVVSLVFVNSGKSQILLLLDVAVVLAAVVVAEKQKQLGYINGVDPLWKGIEWVENRLRITGWVVLPSRKFFYVSYASFSFYIFVYYLKLFDCSI